MDLNRLQIREFGEKIVEGHRAAAESTGAPSADLADQPLSPLCRQPIAPPKEFFVLRIYTHRSCL